MITNEAEIRVALQAILVSVLALYGFWGCAFVVLFILLPWRPFLSVGSYLAQPVVDWRVRKARDRHERGMAQIEQELDAFLKEPRSKSTPPVPMPKAEAAAKPVQPKSQVAEKPAQAKAPPPLEAFMPDPVNEPSLQELTLTAQNLSATLAIPPAIKDHVRNLPQGAFNNMDLEVEQVKFHGDTAEAYVKFQSPNVKELVIHQRYVLRKSGGQWQVESRQPANGSSNLPPYPVPTWKQPMRLA
jgi:hypothetical protein